MRCPRCDVALEPVDVDGEIVERCERCGGEFCSNDALRSLLSAHAAPPGARGERYRRPSPFTDPVRYRKCPQCGEMMTRRNFRESSGIVVDVCAPHGVWFDRGELAMVIEFAATGALAKAEQDIARRADTRKRLDAWSNELGAVGPRHYLGGTLGGGPGVPVDAIDDIAWLVPRTERDEE
jgi:Zn-finger nucleic acid-binding protein